MKNLWRFGVLALSLSLALDVYAEPAASEGEDESALELADELEDEALATDSAQDAAHAVAASPAAPDRTYLRAKTTPAVPTEKTESSPLRMVCAGLLLLALGAVALHLRRKRTPLNLRGSQVQLTVVTRLAVTPKAQIALVSVGREALLLGVTEHGITTLRSYSMAEMPSLTFPPETEPRAPASSVARTPEPPVEVPSPGQAFQSLLAKASGAKTSTAAPSPTRNAPSRVDEDGVPEHLALALDDAGLLKSSFEDPDGQAQELARRFRELHS